MAQQIKPKETAEASTTTERPPGYDDEGIRHPAVSAVSLPVSSRPAPAGPGEVAPSIVESATPNLAKAQANLEADVDAGKAGTPAEANARARAAAGHRAPDTVDLEEARIRAEDNAAALEPAPIRPKA